MSHCPLWVKRVGFVMSDMSRPPPMNRHPRGPAAGLKRAKTGHATNARQCRLSQNDRIIGCARTAPGGEKCALYSQSRYWLFQRLRALRPQRPVTLAHFKGDLYSPGADSSKQCSQASSACTMGSSSSTVLETSQASNHPVEAVKSGAKNSRAPTHWTLTALER